MTCGLARSARLLFRGARGGELRHAILRTANTLGNFATLTNSATLFPWMHLTATLSWDIYFN